MPATRVELFDRTDLIAAKFKPSIGLDTPIDANKDEKI